MSKPSLIITDNIDLSEKHAIYYDSFYKDNKNIQNVVPTKTSDSSVIANDTNTEYYGLVSTAGKEINNRIYDYDSWKQTVIDGTWIKPFGKPILRNHDLYYSAPEGRITDSFFYDHATDVVTSDHTNNNIPKEVLDFYKSIGAFNDGSGSVIVKFTLDKNTSERVNMNLDMTLSQSSLMSKAVCGICGQNYYSEDCHHVAGKMYEVEQNDIKKQVKCTVHTKDYIPIELSLVNFPANDTSIIYKYHPPKNNDKKSDTKEEINTLENDVNNIDKNNSKKQDTKGENDKMYKDLAKKHLMSKTSDFLKMTEDNKKCFEDFFETIQEDQLNPFEQLLEAISSAISSDKQTLKELLMAELTKDNESKKAEEEATQEAKQDDTKKAEEKTDDKTSNNDDSDNKTEEKTETHTDHKDAKDKFYVDNNDEKPVFESKELLALIKNI